MCCSRAYVFWDYRVAVYNIIIILHSVSIRRIKNLSFIWSNRFDVGTPFLGNRRVRVCHRAKPRVCLCVQIDIASKNILWVFFLEFFRYALRRKKKTLREKKNRRLVGRLYRICFFKRGKMSSFSIGFVRLA